VYYALNIYLFPTIMSFPAFSLVLILGQWKRSSSSLITDTLFLSSTVTPLTKPLPPQASRRPCSLVNAQFDADMAKQYQSCVIGAWLSQLWYLTLPRGVPYLKLFSPYKPTNDLQYTFFYVCCQVLDILIYQKWMTWQAIIWCLGGLQKIGSDAGHTSASIWIGS